MTKQMTIDELLNAVLDSEEPDAPADAIGRTSECLSFSQFESHAKGTKLLSPKHIQHVNRCPDYCQPQLQRFRDHLRPISLPAFLARQDLAASPDKKGNPVYYDGVVQLENGRDFGTAKIAITDGPFWTADDYLVFAVSVLEPRFGPEHFPVEIAAGTAFSPSIPIVTFDIGSPAGEILKIKTSLLGEAARTVKDTNILPFVFAIRPRGKTDLICKS